MLVYFSLKNYGPFKEECTFDMRAIEAYKEHPYSVAEVNDMRILKVAEIHGANASGKSQLIKAYNDFRTLVLRSFRTVEDDLERFSTFYTPFLFDSETRTQDIEFEAEYAKAEGRYQYGFTHNSDCITSEWLYFTSAETNRKSTIVERTNDTIEFGASVRTECKKYENDIPDSSLVLSFLANMSLGTSVFERTLDCVLSVLPISSRMNNTNVAMEIKLQRYFMHDFNEAEKQRLLRFLSAIDTEIKDITVERSEHDVQVRTHHVGVDGKKYGIPLEIESDGTRKAIVLYSYIGAALKNNLGLMIDELDAQLHPFLLRGLVSLFYDVETNGQLIFTCHTTELLDKNFGRRDQYWFVEKDKGGASSLFALAEFKIRNDLSFAPAYLRGKFGAVPEIGDLTLEVF